MCQEAPSLVPKVLRACPDSWLPRQPDSLRGAKYPCGCLSKEIWGE